MKPALFLGAAVIFFAALLAAAYFWDLSRAADAAREAGAAADRELTIQEERVIRSLPAAGIHGDELDRAIAGYRAAETPSEKRLNFEGILTIASKSPPQALDMNDLAGRRAADEYTGALNRRQIALRAYEDAVAR